MTRKMALSVLTEPCFSAEEQAEAYTGQHSDLSDASTVNARSRQLFSGSHARGQKAIHLYQRQISKRAHSHFPLLRSPDASNLIRLTRGISQ